MPRKAQLPDLLLESFLRVADKIDIAQRALLSAIPTSRDPGAPLEVAVYAFEDSLAKARDLMPSWLDESVAQWHAACEESITHALEESRKLHGVTLEFEALNARVGDALHPLERFVEAERFMRKRKR